MPAYTNNPFTQVPLLVPGIPVYVLGSYNPDQAQSRILVTNTALAANVATVTGSLVEGPPPIVGGTISIQATQNGAGVYNVNRAIITGVTFTTLTGLCVITFALTNANVASAADTGTAIVDNPEIPETIVARASQAIAVAHQQAQQFGNRTIAVGCNFPAGLPTAVTVSLQAAIHNIDSEYGTIGIVTQVAGGAYSTGFGTLAEFVQTEANYYRVLVSGLTGTGTIACKILA